MQPVTILFISDFQERVCKPVKNNFYEAGRQVVGLGDLSIMISLEIQNHEYGEILYLIDYIFHGFHVWYLISISKQMTRDR